MSGLLYVDDLVLCGESKEDLRAMVGRFVEACRRGLKVNAFKYLGCVLDESGNEAECSRKVASGRRVTGAIRSLVNATSLQL